MTTPRFLEMVATKILGHQLPTEQLTIVLPNRRAGVFLNHAISKQIDKPILLPSIITIEEYFYELSELQPIENTEQLFLLFESAKAVGYETDFDTFLNWGPTLLTDFNDIDTNLVETKTFFHELYYDKELRNWKPGEALSEKQEKYLSLWQAAEKIYSYFTNALLDRGQAYTGLAYRIATQKLENVIENNEHPALFFCGFNALNGAEEKLFRHHNKNKTALILWDYDNYYKEDSHNKAGHYFREYEKHWPHVNLTPRTNIGSNQQHIEYIAAPNSTAQCMATGALINQLSNEKLIDNNTAIILADENLLQPLLFQLPESAAAVNITMGKALTEFEIYHFFDQYLFLHQIAAEQGKFSVGILQSLLANVELRENYPKDIDAINSYIIKQNRAFLSAKELLSLVTSTSFWSNIFQPNITGIQAIDYMNVLINYWRKAVSEINQQINLQFLFELRRIFNLTHDLVKTYQPDITLKTLRSLLQQLCRATKLPFEGEPLQGLQIMGMLESRCLDFENVIVVAANEGVLPKARGNNSFIPELFKERYQIQGYKAKDAIYAYSFYRLLHHCKKAFFIYNLQNGHLGGGEMSRFLKQIKAEYPLAVTATNPISKTILALDNTTIDKNNEVEKTPEIIQKLYNYISNIGLSASALGLYIKNPLDFYYRYVIGLKVPKELETDIELSSFGTLVHKSLEEIYRPYINSTLNNDVIVQLQASYKADFIGRYEKNFGGSEVVSGVNFLMRTAGLKMIEECIKLDQNRIKNEEIIIKGLELDKPCNIIISVNQKPIAVKLKGSIDRLQSANGRVEVLDYKTGKAKSLGVKNLTNINNKPDYRQLLQLMVYATMAIENGYATDGVHGGIISLISYKRGVQYITDASKINALIDLETVEDFKGQLQIILEEMLNPEVPFALRGNPDDTRYSDFSNIYQ